MAAAALFLVVLGSPLEIGGSILYLSLALLFGFALVASLQAWLTAKGVARERARAIALAFGTLVAVPLIACGILRTQHFELDPRICWTIKQSTVAAAVERELEAVSVAPAPT